MTWTPESVSAQGRPSSVAQATSTTVEAAAPAEFADQGGAALTAWQEGAPFFLIEAFLLAALIFTLVYLALMRSVSRLTQSLRAIRAGEAGAEEIHRTGLLEPLTGEIAKMTRSLRQARRSASEEARLRLEKLDSPWTAERLREFVKAQFKERPIFVLSNGEPYVNEGVRGSIEWRVPAGGVVTALEPVMEACGGVWIAHGSGSADREVADEEGKVAVPHEEPRYTLKRIYLSAEEVAGYYDGFSNEALWPLCHMAHVRPEFRADDWTQYRKVNGMFAKTFLEETRQIERPVVLVQDYHLALVPDLVKRGKPDALVALFWHIPWPSAAQFSICPYRAEILEGMLGADLVCFHTQQHCNNFLETVANEVESRIDYERFSVLRGEHRSFVKPFPVSVAFPGSAESAGEPDRGVLEQLGVRGQKVVLGVDRLDYIKGIPERLRGFEFLLEEHPDHRGSVTLVQIASPTRGAVGAYAQYREKVRSEAERINAAYGTREWQPVVLLEQSVSHAYLRSLYQIADVMLVTSLHDGMNLVAKEYAAARRDESGTLILSKFTGASRDLKGALIVNPYSAEEIAAALHRALRMPKTEQYRRMKAMRASVRDYNIYRWSAEMLRALAQLE